MSQIIDKPLPALDDLTRHFWEGAKEGKFMIQKCAGCGTHNFYPKPWCIECGSRQLDWVQASGKGTIYSFTVSRSVAMNYPGWTAELPVVLALVDLEEGVRLYAQITDCAPENVYIGMPVQAWIADLIEGMKIPKFKPAQ